MSETHFDDELGYNSSPNFITPTLEETASDEYFDSNSCSFYSFEDESRHDPELNGNGCGEAFKAEHDSKPHNDITLVIQESFDDDFDDNSGSGYESESNESGGEREYTEQEYCRPNEGNNGWGRGIAIEMKSTLGTHWKEEMTNFNFRTIGVSLYIFFAALAPAVTFGVVYGKSTNNYIGTIEMLVATAWCGIVYGFIRGQPMVVNGGTGPVLAFATVLYQTSKIFGIPFLTLNAWTGLWIGVFLCIAAVVDTNRLIKHLTRFTDEIFAALISAIFVMDAIGNPLNGVGAFWYFSPDHQSHRQYTNVETYSHLPSAFLSCILMFGTSYGAFYLRSMKHSRFLANQACRNIICDFAVVISIILCSILANIVFKNIPTETMNVPDSFAPTFQCCDSSCHSSFPLDCPDQEEAWGRRPWLVDLGDTGGKPWVPFIAAGSAMFAFFVVFFDNGITWHLINHPSNKLTHGNAYNYDTIVIGIMIAINSMFGLPWIVAATVRSITHVHAMAEKDSRGKITHVQETRLTQLLVHVLVLVAILALQIIKLIPVPVMYGVFLFMGVASLGGNELWARFRMLFMQPSRLPDEPFTKYLPHKRMHLFTIIQVSIFICLILFRSIPQIAIAFPTLFRLCIPFRTYLLPRLFSAEELILLDAEDHAIKELVEKFRREGHMVMAVTRNSRIFVKAAFDFANEETMI